MAIDLSRFIATFFDEAQEHLESIEERAMALGRGGGDGETLNAIFRAAHSIKGGAGTFGFGQLADATHEMETLFDALRKGQGKADDATVRLLLDACDSFKGHLARLKAGERDADPAMDALRTRIIAYRTTGFAVTAAPTEPKRETQATEESFFDAPESAPAPAAKPAAFGFFEDAPGVPAAAAATPPHPLRRREDREKYGIFEGAEVAPTDQNRRKGDASSIRVSVEKIDRIVNLVGELVIAQAMMQQAARAAGGEDDQLSHSLDTLERNTRELQQAAMSIRMMPMEFVFSRFPRVIYDVSSKLGKKVTLRTQGQETELDKELIELLVDPLTHVVRNSIDHGIETPAERVRAGKPEAGTLWMRATHRGGSVIIEVTDDGRGLERERILAKAREMGMPVDEGMSDPDVWNLIFEAGFSTAKEVTAISGRGVGMDVVRRNITSLGGSVTVSSPPGKGTTVTIQVPLTLAVLDGMIVNVGRESYIVPLEFVAEAFKPAPGDIRTIVNRPSLVAVRGEHLPIVSLEDVVELPASDDERADPLCLVVEVDGRRAALLVDHLVGQQQLVVKSLDTNLHSVPGMAGATILGDGRVAMILDVASITRATAARIKVAA